MVLKKTLALTVAISITFEMIFKTLLNLKKNEN
jgi:hypothetical protein